MRALQIRKGRVMSRLAVTSRVWRGVLYMWRNPELITLLKTEPFTEDGYLAKHMPQKNLDCVLAAVNWAQRKEAQHG